MSCRITGRDYATSSPAYTIHLFVEKGEGSPAELVSTISQSGDLLYLWYDVAIFELGEHFSAFVEENPALDPRAGPEVSRPYHVWVNRWNSLGQEMAQRHPGFAVDLYKALLVHLRNAQRAWGFVPKGLAFHNIGWTLLLRADGEEDSEPYFVCAMIEDVLHDLQSDSPSGFRSKPAYRTLASLYRHPVANLDAIATFTQEFVQARRGLLRSLISQNGDLLYLEFMISPRERRKPRRRRGRQVARS